MIAVSRLAKNLGGSRVIENLSFELEDGEMLVVHGPSGSGKTTLLRLIAGLELPDQGEIWLDGRLASRQGWGLPPYQRGVGMAFQAPGLWPHMTAAQNILFGLEARPRPVARQRLEELVEILHLQGLEERYPHQLSGGEARRVGLARALAPKPRYLLLDEPLAHLDPALKRELLEVVRLAAKESDNLVYVTHEESEAASLGGTILRLVKDSREASPGEGEE